MIPEKDQERLRSLSRAARGGTLDPLQLAEHAYEMGSAACHTAPTVAPTLNLVELEKLALKRAIEETGSNIIEACKLLGIGKTSVYRKIKEYGLSLQPTCCPNCGRRFIKSSPAPAEAIAMHGTAEIVQ